MPNFRRVICIAEMAFGIKIEYVSPGFFHDIHDAGGLNFLPYSLACGICITIAEEFYHIFVLVNIRRMLTEHEPEKPLLVPIAIIAAPGMHTSSIAGSKIICLAGTVPGCPIMI